MNSNHIWAGAVPPPQESPKFSTPQQQVVYNQVSKAINNTVENKLTPILDRLVKIESALEATIKAVINLESIVTYDDRNNTKAFTVEEERILGLISSGLLDKSAASSVFKEINGSTDKIKKGRQKKGILKTDAG